MILYPEWPVLGGGPRISGAVVALAQDDTLITGPFGPSDHWTDGVGWDTDWWTTWWNQSFADLQGTFEIPWGQLQDKLYWFITAPTDPEAAGGAGYQPGAVLFAEFMQNYLNQ